MGMLTLPNWDRVLPIVGHVGLSEFSRGCLLLCKKKLGGIDMTPPSQQSKWVWHTSSEIFGFQTSHVIITIFMIMGGVWS